MPLSGFKKMANMGIYSIKDLENISGIKAHTIRIWEQRYQVIEPSRSKTNIRFYTDAQLKKLLNISTLIDYGLKISKIAALSHNELNSTLLNLTEKFDPDASKKEFSAQINELTIAMIDLNEERFGSAFNNCLLTLGFETTIFKVVYPFMMKVGLMWGVDKINPAQEHFIYNLIRQKIIVAIDSLPPAEQDAKKYILFLPENELHEMGLLIAYYILRLHGKKVVYLGQNVPLPDVIEVSEICKADIIYCFLVLSRPPIIMEAYLKELDMNFADKELFVAGSEVFFKDIKENYNINFLTSPNDLVESIK